MSKDKQQVQQDNQSKTHVNKPVQEEKKRMETAVSTPIHSLQRAHTNPRTLSSADAQTLQRTIGNQALGRLIIQRKMTLGPVGDKYEQEADAVAKQVVGKLHAPQMQPTSAETTQRQEEEDLQMKPLVQRQEEEELQMKPLPSISSLQRQEEEELQMKPVQRQEEEELQAKNETTKGDSMLAGGELSGDVESSVQSAKSGGQPMSDNIRAPMEQAFNADFSGVKVHTDSQSDTLNRSLSARAFTSGQDVFFRQGEYNPSNNGGQELLAHELTHVVQQNGRGNVQRQPEKTAVSVNQTAPDHLLSLKRRQMHLDFVRIKKKDTHIAKMMLSKMKLAKKPDDAYGHWWIEIGDKTGGASHKVGSWTPIESYGWWPSRGVSIKETFKGIPGQLNQGDAKDPHHGDDAKTEYHPVKTVDDTDDYETIRNQVLTDIRQFAQGFQGSWNWRFGWGKNCHTFLDRLKKRTHLHHQTSNHWLLRPGETESMGDKHRTEFLNETVLASVKSTGLNGIGEIFIETIDDGTLARNINVSLEDYQEINADTREEILAYLEVSAEVMNNRLRQEFGEEMEADIF